LSKKFPKTFKKEAEKPKPAIEVAQIHSQNPQKESHSVFTKVEETENQAAPPKGSQSVDVPATKKKTKRSMRVPFPAPRNTQKVIDQFGLNREAFQKAKEAEDKERKAAEEKERRLAEKAARFREKMNLNNKISNTEKLELLTQQKLNERREREAAYRAQMKELNERLENREFSVAQAAPDVIKRQQMLEQIRVLLKAYDIFVGKNPGQDLGAVFSKEELKLIQEGKYLRKHGYLK